jgi:uncharacterized protein (TIGR03435 family)
VRRAVLAVLVIAGSTLAAQIPATDSATFEVVSVKPLPAGSNRTGYRPEPTRFSGYFSVIDAMAFAYQIQQDRIVDAPPWARDQRYEINARTAPRKPGDIQSMMRHLLADRFALKAHRERRAIPVYALLLSRGDGDFGFNLRRVERDCSRPASNLSGCSASFGVGRYRQDGLDWEAFVGSLETRITVGRPIVDKTGLSGQFDITLEWNPDITRVPENVGNAPTLAELEARPVLFTALREQLGVRLESDTAAMDVLVIDSVDRPTPD